MDYKGKGCNEGTFNCNLCLIESNLYFCCLCNSSRWWVKATNAPKWILHFKMNGCTSRGEKS